MELATIFGNNMVFQAQKPFRIFGTGVGTVSMTLGGLNYEKKFETESWVWELPMQDYGGPYDLEINLDGKNETLKNIAFGDVFLCAGQSNMQFTIADEKTADSVISDDKIRYYVSTRGVEEKPETSDEWYVLSKENAPRWSALGLHIAEEYRKKKDVFVGIVGSFQGASVIRTWMPERKLDEKVYVDPELRHHKNVLNNDWKTDSYMYLKSFLPITPFSFKHAIWYQGESNTAIAEAEVYTLLLSRLIDAWREDLLDADLPFTVIEICDYKARDDEAWHAIQRCQQEIVNVSNNVDVVASKDVCDHSNIHPANKQALAKKVAAVLPV